MSNPPDALGLTPGDSLDLKFARGGTLPPELDMTDVIARIIAHAVAAGHAEMTSEQLTEIYGDDGSMKLFDDALGPYTLVALSPEGEVAAHCVTKLDSVILAQRISAIITHTGVSMFGRKVSEVRIVTRDAEMLPANPANQPGVLPGRPIRA